MKLRYLFTIIVILLIVPQIDYEVLIAELKGINFSLFFLSCCAIAAQIFFLNVRWHLLLNAGRGKLGFKTSSMINIAGIFANTLFISSIGGIVVKSALSIHYGISVLHSFFATLLDRFLTLFALIALSLLALPVVSNVIDQNILSTIALCAILAGFMAGGFLIILHSGILKSHVFTNQKRIRLLASFKNLAQDRKNLSIVIGCSLISQCFFILATLLLAQGFDFQGDFFALASLIPVLALIASIPISIGGWGVREGAFIYGLGLIGFAKESALLLSIQVGLVTLITPMIIGLFFIPFSATFRKTIKQNI